MSDVSFFVGETALEVFYFLTVAFEEGFGVDYFFFLGFELLDDVASVEIMVWHRLENGHTWTFLIPWANLRVLVVSATALVSGLMVQMTEMRALPESEGSSMRVSFELRKGT